MKISGGLLHGFTDEGKGGEVQHAFDGKVLEDFAQAVSVRQLGFDKNCFLGNGIAIATREIVVDHDFVAEAEQLLGDDATDVSGAAGY